MDNRLMALAVAALVVFSGCAAIGGGGSTATPTPSRTPTAVPGSTPSDDLGPVSALSSLPPGVDGGSVTNVSAIAAENQRLLTAGGFDVRMTIADSSKDSTAQFHVANDTTASRVRLTGNQRTAGASTDLVAYVDADESGSYNRTSGEMVYASGPTRTRLDALYVLGVVYSVQKSYVAAPDWRTTGSYTTDTGEERLVLHADALRPLSERETGVADIYRRDKQARSVDARTEVTPDGLVRTLNVTLGIDSASGGPYTLTVSYAAVDLEPGSLSQPEWLSEAPQLSASVEAEDELLVVEHTGGSTIEVGTNLTVSGGLASLGTVAADRPIAEGDTLYVYATGEGLDRTLHLAVNERPTPPENATAFSGEAAIRGSQDDTEFAAAVQLTDATASETGDAAASSTRDLRSLPFFVVSPPEQRR